MVTLQGRGTKEPSPWVLTIEHQKQGWRVAMAGAARRTDDPVSPETLTDDVNKLFDVLDAGGFAIVPLDVAYGVNATKEEAMRKVFAAKNRSYDKLSGMFANITICREIHLMDDWKYDLAETLIREEGLPFSIVAPFRTDHPLLANVDPFVLETSTKAGTMDMLLNAGQFHDEVARQAWERQNPVFGSSANTSLAGSKYRYEDIEAPVRDAASIYFDYGTSKYENPDGRSSTIIDFQNFSVIRVGVVFDRVLEGFRKHGGIDLKVSE